MLPHNSLWLPKLNTVKLLGVIAKHHSTTTGGVAVSFRSHCNHMESHSLASENIVLLL